MAQQAAALLVGVLLALLQATALQAAPLDDTHRNDGLSMQQAGLHRSAVYESHKRAASNQQQLPPVYLSLKQTITAPSQQQQQQQQQQQVLPVCLGPDEVSRALEAGINAAFQGQLSQSSAVDTTYVQKLDQCTYRSFITYWGPADISKTLVEAGKAGLLCDKLPQYCKALNFLTETALAAAKPARSRRQASLRSVSSVDSSSSSGSGSGGLGATKGALPRRRSSGPYVLAQSTGSTAPDLPPVLHYNCQKHYFKQRLDHFAAEAAGPDSGPDSEGSKNPSGGPDYQSGPDDHHYHEEVRYGDGPHPGYGADVPDKYGIDGSKLGHDFERLHELDHVQAYERKRAKKMKKQAKQIKQIKKSVKGHKMEVEGTAGVLSLTEEYFDEDSDVQTAGVQATIQQQRFKLGPSWKPHSAKQPNQQADRQIQNRVSRGAVPRPMPGALADSSSSSSGSDGVGGVAAWPEEQQVSSSGSMHELPATEEVDVTPEQQALFDAASDTLPAWRDAPASRAGSTPHQEALFDAVSGALPGKVPDTDFTDETSLQQDASMPAWKWNTLYSLVADTDTSAQQELDTDSVSASDDDEAFEGATDGAAEGVIPAPLGAPQAAAGASDGQQQSGKQAVEQEGMFRQVYWVCDAAWPTEPQKQREVGNVVLFLGNEGPLGVPQQPIVFENARRLNALVVLVEHRYYGESLPFDEPADQPLPTANYQWLNMAQVIEDSVAVVAHVRKERAVPTATPNIVIGGSYGGMLAAYHRLKRPDYFAAAVASSAPMSYIVDTPMWSDASDRYHQIIRQAADVMSGGTSCSNTIREGLATMLDAAISEPGRQQLAQTFRLCDAARLDSKEAAQALQRDVMYSYQGFAQVNNQPPLLNQMALACQLITNTTAAGCTPLEALAAVHTFFNSDTLSDWCYGWGYNPRAVLVPGGGSYGYNSYSYQCCTQGTVYSSLLPAEGTGGSLNPEGLPVSVKDVQAECRAIFGSDVKPLHGPGFARNFMRLLRREGGVVFTNGDLDGWAGGSLGVARSRQTPDGSGNEGRGDDRRGAGVHTSSSSSSKVATSKASGVGVAAAAVKDVGSLTKKAPQAAAAAAADTAVQGAGGSKGTAQDAASGASTAAQAAAAAGKVVQGVSKGTVSGGSSASRAAANPAHVAPKQGPRHEGQDRAEGPSEYDQSGYAEDAGHDDRDDRDGGSFGGIDCVAFITYKNASHCTDTHTYAWQTPGEPPEWKQQRAEAMDRAAEFAMTVRQAALRDLRQRDPLLPLVPQETL